MSQCIHCSADLPAEAAFCPECGRGQAAADDAPALMTLGGLETIGASETRSGSGDGAPLLEAGARFADRYTIVGPLGSGGMGVVYRAKDDVGDRDVALKLIRPDRAASEREIERLVDEGLTSRDIRHKNVVAVYDVGVHGGTPYLSMEVVEGQSLRAWMRSLVAAGEDAAVEDAVAIAREVAEGLRAAHAKGVVHRDLKPENVVLEAAPEGGRVALKVLDFGIARAGRGTRADSGTGSGVGTPRYMAPEQVTNADLAGPSADVYSLSVMLYELLVGVLPQGHWQPPSSGRSGVSRALDDLVHEGLSNRPQARPQSMDDFIERLDAAVGGGGGESLFDAGRRAAENLERTRAEWRRAIAARWTPKWTRAAVIAGALMLGLGALDAVGAFDPEPPSYAGDDGPGGGGRRPSFAADEPLDGPGKGGPWSKEGPYDEPEFDGDLPGGAGPLDDWSVLSGTWQHATGNAFDVTVTRLGRIRGEGSILMNDGFEVGRIPATIRGKITDGEIEFSLRIDGSVFVTAEGAWLGGGSFAVQYFSPDGFAREADTILVNGGSAR